jgi:hypothetical protein
VKRELQRIEIPGEYDARRRTWDVVRAAYLEREPVSWPRRHVRELALAAGVVAIVAAAVTPPGHSVVNSIRDAVGREKVVGVRNAQRELVRLPAPGRLLVQSRRGAWIVQRDGSRRLLGRYSDASWSPRGLFVAGVLHRHELVALEPNGTVRWEKPRNQVVRLPRWSSEGFRIAYFSGKTLRVIWGNGEHDRRLGPADPTVAPAWKPGSHTVAWLGADGEVRVADVDGHTTPSSVRHATPVVALGWAGGELAAVATRLGGVVGTVVAAAIDPRTGRTAEVVRAGDRSRVYLEDSLLFSGKGRVDSLAFSPDARWLALGWPSADQLVFVRLGAKPKLVAFSNVSEQFLSRSFPGIAGWTVSIE